MNCFKDDTPFRVHVINLNVGACWSHIWSKGWSLFKRKHHLMTCTDSRTQQRTCAERPIQNSPVHKVPIPPLTRQDMQIEESSTKDDCPVPSRSRTCRCTWLPKPTKQGWRTSLCPRKNGDPIFLQPDTRRFHQFSKCWEPLGVKISNLWTLSDRSPWFCFTCWGRRNNYKMTREHDTKRTKIHSPVAKSSPKKECQKKHHSMWPPAGIKRWLRPVDREISRAYRA